MIQIRNHRQLRATRVGKARKDLLPWVHSSLKQRSLRGTLIEMSADVAELKDRVLALPQTERHELVVWINQLEANCGDVPGEVLYQLAAEIWDQDDRHAPP